MSYAEDHDVAREFDSDEFDGRSILRCVLAGALTGVAATALVMAAFFLAPNVFLPWTIVIAVGLAVLLFIGLMYIPYRADVVPGNLVTPAQPDPRMLADEGARQREQLVNRLKDLQGEIETAKDAIGATSRTQKPQKWAKAMSELGRLQLELAVAEKAVLGRRAKGASLKQAGAAYRRALNEQDFDRVPQDWAVSMLGLAKVLLALGERSSHPPYFEEAIAAFSETLRVLTDEKNPVEMEEVREGIASAKEKLDEIRTEQREHMEGKNDDF